MIRTTPNTFFMESIMTLSTFYHVFFDEAAKSWQCQRTLQQQEREREGEKETFFVLTLFRRVCASM